MDDKLKKEDAGRKEQPFPTAKQSMLEIQKNFLLKIKIIELLDNHPAYLSVRQITDLIPDATFNAVKLACSELREEFDMLYQPEQIELIVNPRKGMKLIRKGKNIHTLIEHVITESLTYKIICQVFLERQVNVADFCQHHYISNSTLARQLKLINQTLHNYNMHISFSNRMSLKGQEGTIRLFLQFLLFDVHSTIDSIPWITDSQTYLTLTTKILRYLNVSVLENQVQHIATFVFLISNSIQRKFNIQSNDTTLAYRSYYYFPNQPAFLADWSEADWHFFLIYIHASNISSIPFSLITKEPLPFASNVHIWLDCFEQEFGTIETTKKERMVDTLHREFLLDAIFCIDEFLLALNEIVRITNLSKDFPEYIERFQRFWKNFSAQCLPLNSLDYMKEISFLNSVSLVNLIAFNPTIKVFVFSNVAQLHQQFIETRINYHLSKYQVIFVTNYLEADIVISTVTFLNHLPAHQKLVEIRASLPITDLIAVEQAVEEVLQIS